MLQIFLPSRAVADEVELFCQGYLFAESITTKITVVFSSSNALLVVTNVDGHFSLADITIFCIQMFKGKVYWISSIQQS